MPSAPASETETHRHVKTGHLVREIGRGFAQVSVHPIEEMTAVSIYEHDGRLWVRNAVEFDDGRFEELPVSRAEAPAAHSERLRKSLQSVADSLSKRPAELRGPFKMPSRDTDAGAAPAAGVALEALIERYRAQVRVARAYAMDDAKGAPTSTFEIMVQHFAGFEAEFAAALVSSAAEIAELRAKLSLALDTVDMNYHHCKQAEERAESAAAERDKACKEVDMLLSAAAARGEEPDLMLREFENLNEQIDAAAAKERSLRDCLEATRKRVKNARGAIESNQVTDKDVHGTLTRCIAEIDATLTDTAVSS